jgi:hypothetical protein
MMKYKVVAAIDSLDPNPEVLIFDDHYEASDFIYEEVHRRVLYQVEHSPYSLTDEELDHMREQEMCLFTFSEIDED